MDDLRDIIRDIPDFPKKGVMFKDITTLLKDKHSFRRAIDLFYKHYKDKHIDVVVSVESRGFIFGSVLAYKLNAGFVPVRKPGKLPHHTISESYELEYGVDILEIHSDSLHKGQNVLVIDDLLATGGTLEAVISIVSKLEANIVGIGFLIELLFLNGRERLKDFDVFSIIQYDN
ncbi:adenine phosphoribosyltransferase [bacterium]